MANADDITLHAATLPEAGLLANLLELYIHDLSPFFPNIVLGPDGRFGYDRLSHYWSEPERRFPFLIRRGPRVAGFALVTRGSPVTDDPDVFDIAEFFVLRRERRAGVGRQAAFLLWNRLPGRWLVRVSERNAGALPFWASAIADYTHGQALEQQRQDGPTVWRVFSFNSVAPSG